MYTSLIVVYHGIKNIPLKLALNIYTRIYDGRQGQVRFRKEESTVNIMYKSQYNLQKSQHFFDIISDSIEPLI